MSTCSESSIGSATSGLGSDEDSDSGRLPAELPMADPRFLEFWEDRAAYNGRVPDSVVTACALHEFQAQRYGQPADARVASTLADVRCNEKLVSDVCPNAGSVADTKFACGDYVFQRVTDYIGYHLIDIKRPRDDMFITVSVVEDDAGKPEAFWLKGSNANRKDLQEAIAATRHLW